MSNINSQRANYHPASVRPQSFQSHPKEQPLNACPTYYAGTVTPWDLQKCMKTSGSVFVDARRTDAIEYCFRMKDDLVGDLHKARHCIDEAIKVLETV
jgi:hypothetical protein